MRAITIIFCGAILSTTPQQSWANNCNELELSVAALVKEAQNFQRSQQFQQVGFSRNGPFASWHAQALSLRGHPDTNQFFHDHGYVPIEVFSVVDEYRTRGYLDAFYQETEDLMLAGPHCD